MLTFKYENGVISAGPECVKDLVKLPAVTSARCKARSIPRAFEPREIPWYKMAINLPRLEVLDPPPAWRSHYLNLLAVILEGRHLLQIHVGAIGDEHATTPISSAAALQDANRSLAGFDKQPIVEVIDPLPALNDDVAVVGVEPKAWRLISGR